MHPQPIIYTGLTNGISVKNQEAVKDMLKENNIHYTNINLGEFHIIRTKLVPKIRGSRFAGTYEDLSQLPIMEYGGKTYPARVITNKERLLKILKTEIPEKYVQPATPVIHKDNIDETEINVMLNKLLEKDIQINEYFYNLNEEQQKTFIIAIRLQRHFDAHMLIEFSKMITEWLGNKAESLDPCMNKQRKEDKHIYMWWIE